MRPTRFAGKRALVTGGARGIGLAIAERLTSEGCRVLIADVDHERAGTVAAGMTPGTVQVLPLDVSDAAAVLRTAETIGNLDIVIANAGVQTYAPATELPAEQWNRIHAINALGTLLTLQLAARCLRSGGSAVVIASIQALLPNPLSAHYAASKAASLSLTKSFAAELAPRGLRVNAIAPGRIDTELSDAGAQEVGRLTHQHPAEVLRNRLAGSPLGRIGRPDEIASVAAFLASEDASYITGECINVCGGDIMT